MIIGVDIDEVLAELLESYLEYHNQNFNTQAQKKDMFSYSFREVFGYTEEENQRRILHFFKSRHFSSIVPVKEAREAIKLLVKEHQLCIITARPHVIEEQTKQWLSTHFPNSFHCINLTNQWHGVGAKQLKSQVGKREKIDILIDDSLQHALDCASQGIYVLLADFNYPWNQTAEKLPENIKRVHSWKEIVEEIDRYGRGKSRG